MPTAITGTTATATPIVKPLRPPDPTSWPLWLGEEPAKSDELKAILGPYPSAGMTCWPVSKRVDNVKNNDPNLVEPIASADA